MYYSYYIIVYDWCVDNLTIHLDFPLEIDLNLLFLIYIKNTYFHFLSVDVYIYFYKIRRIKYFVVFSSYLRKSSSSSSKSNPLGPEE